MSKILFLTAYPEEDASCRYRIYQFIPWLMAAGHECTVAPFATPDLFFLLRSRGRLSEKILEGFRCSVRRFHRILAAAAYDLIVIHREAFPFFAPRVEKLLLSRARRGRTKVIFSFDDAIFAGHGDTSALNHPWLYRWKHGRGYNDVIRDCDHVIAGNRLLAEYATQLNPAVTVIPTVVDCDKYRTRETSSEVHPPATIGWMGSHTTAPYLRMVEPVLRRLASVHGSKVRFCFVGCPEYNPDFGSSVSAPFRLETEIQDLQGFDIGLMPQPDDAWARGKCAFKAIQYMATGVVTVASPVGITPEVLDHGRNGFLASSLADWFDVLDHLLRDHRLRLQIAHQARRTVEDSYSLRVWAPRMAALIEQLLGTPRLSEREILAA